MGDEYRKEVVANQYTQLLTDDECSSESDDYSISWDDRGDGLDAFNMGYEEIFSPYSNPSSSSCNSGNTGLTIALTQQNSTTGAIIVKIYYDNNTTALHDLPPSKPKNVKVTEDFITQYSYHPEIKWDANIEPDFVSATYGAELVAPEYEIYRGYSSDCDVEPDYSLLTTLASNITEYIDNSVTLYTDDGTDPGQGCNFYLRTYSYKVAAIDNRGASSLKSERGLTTGLIIACASVPSEDNILNSNIPKEYKIYQNYPNPFNPVTTIRFDLPVDNIVKLKVYDILGKEVFTLTNEFKTAGSYTTTFDASNLPSGIYYYKIQAGEFVAVRKMIVIK